VGSGTTYFFDEPPVNPQVVSEIVNPTRKIEKPFGGHHSNME
jgi:hypothetical protein